MASSIAENKKELRRRVRQQLTEMTPEELKAADDAMFASFLALPQVEAAQNIFAFQNKGDGCLLDRGRGLIAHLIHSIQQRLYQIHFFKIHKRDPVFRKITQISPA